MSVDYKDYYKVLEIERTASADDIQKAYKKLARKYHPDLNQNDPSAEGKFKDVGEAYEVLKDPAKRQQYDALGASWKDGQRFTPPPGWQGMNFGAGGQNVHFNVGGMGGMSDFFQTLFGGMGGMGGGFSSQNFGGDVFGAQGFDEGARRRPGRRSATESPVVDLPLSIEEILDPEPKSISLTFGSQTRSIKVNIPKGAKDKTVFKLKGQGPNGEDLRVRVNLTATKNCETSEFDIIQKLKVTPWEAALGAQLECQTAAGNVRLTLPAGVQSGQKLRLPGKGLFMKQGRGDLMMEVQIQIPKKLSQEEKELFENLAKISTFNPRD